MNCYFILFFLFIIIFFFLFFIEFGIGMKMFFTNNVENNTDYILVNNLKDN